MRKSSHFLIGCAALAFLAVSSPARATEDLLFAPPVLVSPALGAAWEPTMLTDRFGNIFITARKDTGTSLAVAADDRSATQTRSASWLWMSSDRGETFTNVSMPAGADHEWGYEADIALDGADHLLFVDQTYADATITRWTITGPGALTPDFHRPALPTAQPVDDRPWISAHGDGVVFYTANDGDPALNPVSSQEGGDAFGPGRYSIYRSSDGGQTFETTGHLLRESGACRTAADATTKDVYVVCTNDGNVQGDVTAEPHGRGKVWAFVSHDDGATFTRTQIGDYNADAETFDWPLVTVAANGDVWALHVDADTLNDDGSIKTNKLMLYHSSDHGRTWSRRNITPESGRYRWGALAASKKGDLAFAIQHRPAADSDWGVYATRFAGDETPVLKKLDTVDAASQPEPPSELVGLAFTPLDELAVAWTRIDQVAGQSFPRVYFARSKIIVAVKGGRHARHSRRLPATGIDDAIAPAVSLLVAAGALKRRISRTRSL